MVVSEIKDLEGESWYDTERLKERLFIDFKITCIVVVQRQPSHFVQRIYGRLES